MKTPSEFYSPKGLNSSAQGNALGICLIASMKKIIFSLCVCLLPSLSAGQELLTIDDIRIMHEAGVKIQFDVKSPLHVLPADTKPGDLLNVQLIDLSDAPLYRIPPWLKRFTNLRRLDLSKNHLDADSDLLEVLQAMPKLDVLNLSGNPLFKGEAAGQSLAQVWQSLSELGELYMSGTQGTAKNFGSLAPLTSLKILDLSGNQLGNEVSALELNKLAGLEELNLSDNGISTFPGTKLPARNLRLLDLSKNNLKEIPYIEMNELLIWHLQDQKNNPVRLDDDYGDTFSLKKIKKFQCDKGSYLPEGLKKKLNGIAAREKERLWKIACPGGSRKIGQYLDNCDGTITDSKTGLMWKRCSEGLSGVNCEEGKAEEHEWDDAVSRFKNVEYAAYKDWRLPTIEELKTLVYCSNGVKDKDNGRCTDDSETPTINQQAFPNTPSTVYWSGSPIARFSNGAWYVGFDYGDSADGYLGNVNLAVRLVRGGQ